MGVIHQGVFEGHYDMQTLIPLASYGMCIVHETLSRISTR